MVQRLLLSLRLVLLILTPGECHNLTFMFVTSFGELGPNSSSAVPGVDVALEGIRNRTDMLPGYNLVYNKVRDSKVLKSMFVIIVYMHDRI